MKNLQSRLFSSGMGKGATISASLLIWAAAAASPSIASADIMYSNFGPSHTYNVNLGNPVGNFNDGNNYAEGDSFVASETEALTSILVALSCSGAGACPANFTIALRGDSADSPGAVLESFSVSGATLGVIGSNNAPVTVNSVLMPLMTVGTRYWVTVSSTLADSIAWNLNSTGDTSDEALSFDGAASWFSPSNLTPGAFQVNATPEPASLLLLGTLLSGLALRKRLSRG